MDTSKNVNYSDLSAEIEGARASLSVTAERIAELEKKLTLARGTGDVTAEAAAARATVAPKLSTRVEIALRARVLDLRELSIALGAPHDDVAREVAEARKSKKIWNVGSVVLPRWTWRVGDATPTRDVAALVRRLISDQPMTTAEIVAATGVRASRISGILVDIQRTEAGILDLASPGDRHRRWFLVPPAAATARLPPKIRRNR